MYIIQKTYKQCDKFENKEKNSLKVALVLPSTEPPLIITHFRRMVQECIDKINDEIRSGEPELEVMILNHNTKERSPIYNYNAIYRSDVVITECTEHKPNIFYLLGIAHAIGKPVCCCYNRATGTDKIADDIPFNVHGRQSLVYDTEFTDKQDKFKKDIIDWLCEVGKIAR